MHKINSINIGKSLLLLFVVMMMLFPVCLAQDEVEDIEITDEIEDERIVITELYVDGEDEMIVSDRALILTGNITVMNASELMITSSDIQLSIRGERSYNVSILDEGNMIISNSTLNTLSNASLVKLLDNGQLKVINSNLTDFKSLSTSSNSTLIVQGSRVNINKIICTGKNISFTESSMPHGDLNVTVTEVNLEDFIGDNIFLDMNNSVLKSIQCNLLKIRTVDSVYLNESKIKNCEIESKNETFVVDSTFESLTLNSSGIAINVSTSEGGARAGGAIRAAENSTTKILRYWYLTLNVTEMAGLGIPAKITVEDYFGNTILEGKSDVYGLYTEPIIAEIINSTKTVFVGNYKVKATYANVTTKYTPIVLDRNVDIDLQFKSPIPLETSTKLMVPPDAVMVDESVKIEGWIVKELPEEDIEIVASGPGNSSFTLICKTDENGVFEKEFSLNTEGQWTVYADWIGGASYGQRFTKSQAFMLTVQPRPSLMILLIQALPIAVVVIGILTTITFLALGRSKSKV
ncbi:hypothetical protein A3K80_00095 [Candidatus Bathyarchaeota archaeon RBG_13_38_9]|nr:MAG: hypothetical protein A3K80_00095 [Candidatus Bathyarchaeota archaeon RBG_13_38_9]